MRFGALSLLLLAAVGHATEIGEDIRYVPPAGFAGHNWGDLRASFEQLPSTPVGVGAAWMRVQEKHKGFSCQLNMWIPRIQMQWVDHCKPAETLLYPQNQFKAGGTYVVSEYAIDGQGFRFGDETKGVVLHPVIYQFCANWPGRRKRPAPPNFAEINKFCGMKFMFESETLEELSALPNDHVTAYDRVLEKLIDKYGHPLGFERRGKVIIAPAEDGTGDAANRRFRTWNWCSADNEGLRTFCSASVSLTLDPVTGIGAVLYSTPILWEFAFARENYGFKGDPLFRVLHARN